MANKKEVSIDQKIISEYQKFHHKAGKKFKDRIKKFEKFNDTDNIENIQLSHHAEYTVFGKPSDLKSYPGAYNSAYKVLDKHLENDGDKLKDEDKLAEILETYVDSFLQKAMGDSFKKTVEHAKKEGMNDKDLRELKGQLMGQYHTDDKDNPINILHDQYLKQLKGKKKIELVEHLKGMSQQIKDSYTSHLQQKAIEGLISEDDRLDLAKYITPKFKEKGLKHKKAHINRSAMEQAMHYNLLLQGASETLIKKAGYKTFKPEEKKK